MAAPQTPPSSGNTPPNPGSGTPPCPPQGTMARISCAARNHPWWSLGIAAAFVVAGAAMFLRSMPDSDSFGKIAEKKKAIFAKLPKPDTKEDIRKANEKEEKEKKDAKQKADDFKKRNRKLNQETPDNLYNFLSSTSFKELLGKKKGEKIKNTPLCVDDFYPEEDFSSSGFMNYEEVKKEFDALTKNEQQKLRAYALTVTPSYMFDPCLDKKNLLDKNHVGTATFLILEAAGKRIMFVEVPGDSTDKTAGNPNMRYFKFAPDAEAFKKLYQRAVDAPANAFKLLQQKALPKEAKKPAQLLSPPKAQKPAPEPTPSDPRGVPPLLGTPRPLNI